MEHFLRVLKNWWFGIASALAIILDQGFDVINPLLVEAGVSVKAIGFIKLAFGIYAIYRIKKQLPTQNEDKLRDLVKAKL